MNQNTFIKITNEQVYNKLLEIESKLNYNKTRIKINSWMCSTCLAIMGIMVGVLIK